MFYVFTTVCALVLFLVMGARRNSAASAG